MVKRFISLALLAMVFLAIPLQAFAADYEFYDIQTTGTNSGYTTTPGTKGAYRACGSYTVEYMTNRLSINDSSHSLYFMGALVDPWTQATNARWQYTGSGTLKYDYKSPTFTDKKGYYTLFFRRDTDDTYSGGRHVKGSWTVE